MSHIPNGPKTCASHKPEGSLEAVSGSLETLRDTMKDVAASYAAVAASADKAADAVAEVKAVFTRKFANNEDSDAS